MKKNLAIFDLDNTILNGDSDYSWIKFMIDSGNVNYEEYSKKNDYFYEQYYLGKLDYHEWALFVLSTFKGKTPDELEKLLVEFLNSIIEFLFLNDLILNFLIIPMLVFTFNFYFLTFLIHEYFCIFCLNVHFQYIC